ncbi:Dna-cytosine methyltransferase [Klebsiella pneumoniae]|nr:Dna-cytosine methyltransferase [Klebsiella pneumoniae]
MSLKSMVMR